MEARPLEAVRKEAEYVMSWFATPLRLYDDRPTSTEPEPAENEQKEVPATVVACAAVVTVGGPGFCRGATCRVVRCHSSSATIFTLN